MDDSLTRVEELLRRTEAEPELIGFLLAELLESDVLILARPETDDCAKVESLCGNSCDRHQESTTRPASLSFFSSPQALIRALAANGRCFVMRGEDLFRSTRGSHLCLNPGLELGMEFNPELVEDMLETLESHRRHRARAG